MLGIQFSVLKSISFICIISNTKRQKIKRYTEFNDITLIFGSNVLYLFKSQERNTYVRKTKNVKNPDIDR